MGSGAQHRTNRRKHRKDREETSSGDMGPWKGQAKDKAVQLQRSGEGLARWLQSQVVLSLADRAGPASWKHR